jgi:hypothetical protein
LIGVLVAAGKTGKIPIIPIIGRAGEELETFLSIGSGHGRASAIPVALFR